METEKVKKILEGVDELNGKGPIRTAWTRTDMQKASSSLIAQINWFHTILLFSTPLAALSALFFIPLQYNTVVLAAVWYLLTGWGICVGYHRLWSHRSFSCVAWFEYLLAVFGAGALEGSAKWWCRNHRAHHRYCDTDQDPYNATRGFFYAHIGWMLIKQDPAAIGRVNVEDLKINKILDWQHKYYLPLSLSIAFLVPSLIAGLLWDDFWGGFFYAGLARGVVTHHATFFVNSLAHWYGDKPFSDEHTAYDSWITAFLTLGEGFHNFHHTFANDYRNGVQWYCYDPAKWLISFLSYFGVTYNLRYFPDAVLEKVTTLQKGIDVQKSLSRKIRAAEKKPLEAELRALEKRMQLVDKQLGVTPLNALPTWTMEEFEKRAGASQATILLVVEGMVYDVTQWADLHPGGENVLRVFGGKDASKAFNGGVYEHSRIARNFLSLMRVARIAGQK